MKRLFLFSLLSLYSGIFAINCDIDLEIDGYKMHHMATLDERSPYYFQNEEFRVAAHVGDQTEDTVEMHFEIFKKNECGEYELVSSPCIKADFGRTAKVEIRSHRKNADTLYWLVMQVVATR